MERGRLRVYLGAWAGVGTTYSMLDEALRRSQRGARVAIGSIDAHGRARTERLIVDLVGDDVVPTELDVERALASECHLVLVDDLASRHAVTGLARWQMIEPLLASGIDVIGTLNCAQIESVAEPARAVLGRDPGPLVPDGFLRRFAEIEIVDISPWAIRRRIAHGNIHGPLDLTPVDGEVYNSSAFASLRALMMAWMAEHLDSRPDEPDDSRDVVVAALTDGPTSEIVLRRAAHIARRSGSRLLAVHVVTSTTKHPVDQAGAREARRERVDAFGGVMHEIVSDDVGDALVSFAEAERASQLVIGVGPPSRGRRYRVRGRSVIETIVGLGSHVDVHMVATTSDTIEDPRVVRSGLPVARRLGAALLAVTLLTLLTAVLVAHRGEVPVATSLAVYLLVVVAVTAIGGAGPGFTAAVASPLLANWFLIPPYHTFRVSEPENLLELFVFVSVAGIVSFFVSVSARRAAEATRARREASMLAELTGSGDLEDPVSIVSRIRSAFDFDGVAVLSSIGTVIASSGEAPGSVETADVVLPVTSDLTVIANGQLVDPDDHRILRSFAAQLERAFQQQDLRAVAAEADALARADELRTAMLRAVSHDLRSPLASIKASVSSIRQPDVDWPADVRDDFLESIENETDRLTSIVTNLLDLSRLEAGVLRPVMRRTSLEEVVPAAIHGLGEMAADVVVDLPADLVDIDTDPALLERVVANLAANAVLWSPAGSRVRVSGHSVGTKVQVHVVDHGPGIPPHQRSVVVQPFHRLGDSSTSGGLGLGLAIADRLIAAMGGSLDLRDTPGGGLTAVVSMPAPGDDR